MKLFNRKTYIDAEVAYALKPGNHYVIEYDERAVSASTVKSLRSELKERGIDVIFVGTEGGMAFRPVLPEAPQPKKRKVK